VHSEYLGADAVRGQHVVDLRADGAHRGPVRVCPCGDQPGSALFRRVDAAGCAGAERGVVEGGVEVAGDDRGGGAGAPLASCLRSCTRASAS
jgi:hypothetical protein